MISQKLTKQFSFKQIMIKYTVLPLKLRRSFNTAHSTSTTRNNFIIKLTSTKLKISGYGQSGLPPKKPNCYLADIQDCFLCMSQLQKNLLKFQANKQKEQSSLIEQIKSLQLELFEGVDQVFFKLIRQDIKLIENCMKSQQEAQYVRSILQILITIKKLSQNNKCFLAARSALEFAILDQYSIILKVKTAQLIYNQNIQNNVPIKCHSFYTLSHESIQEMIQNGRFGQTYTKYLKIKFDNNVKNLLKFLQILDKQQIGQKWIIDANASWSLKDYKQFQQLLTKNKETNNASIFSKILFIEQPFPVIIDQIQLNQWKQIKKITKLKIIADQSFSNQKDIQKMKHVSHGINIKMQKCGGPISATKILTQLKQSDIQIVMFGSMVSSQLGCTQVYQFRSFAQFFDIDGALLVADPQIIDGFQWNPQQGLISAEGFGLCIKQQNLSKFFI